MKTNQSETIKSCNLICIVNNCSNFELLSCWLCCDYECMQLRIWREIIAVNECHKECQHNLLESESKRSLKIIHASLNFQQGLQPQTGSPLKVEWKQPSQSSFVFKKMHIWLLSHDLTRPNCPHENSIYIHFYYFACVSVSVSVGSWIFHFYFKSMVCGLLTLRWTDVFFPLVLFFLLGVVFREQQQNPKPHANLLFLFINFPLLAADFFFSCNVNDWRPKKE